MSMTYEILKHTTADDSAHAKEVFAHDVLEGLSKEMKSLPSKYFYDDRGSELFSKITELSEYYLTNCGFEILRNYKSDITKLLADKPFRLIELGAGDGRKTKILLEYFLEQSLNFQYVPIDISELAVADLTKQLQGEFKSLETKGLVTDYFSGIKWVSQREEKEIRNFVLFLGSNIGNLTKNEACNFLRELRGSLNKGDLLLIAFDLKKDPEVIRKAYNDSQGVTRDFNLNLLTRINSELGGAFDLNKFTFLAVYNPLLGAVESFIISLEEQEVFIKEFNKAFYFKAWEPIHTEYSFKYTDSDIRDFANQTGFVIEKNFYDSKKYFLQSVWKVV